MVNMNIVVVGDEDFVLGFRLAGIRRAYVAKGESYKKILEELLEDESVGILVLNDDDVRTLPFLMRKRLSESIKPTVISIGKVEEVDLREKIKRAIGVDLWKG